MVKIILNILLVCTINFSFSNAEYKSYKDYKVYKVFPQDDKEIETLNVIRKQGFIFWTDVTKVHSDAVIMVAPDQQEYFVKLLDLAGLPAEVVIKDVQSLIDNQMKRPKLNRINSDYSWDYYQTLDEIFEWLDKVVETYPDIVTLVTMGTTVEGRPIRGIKIDYKKPENPVIGMIEGGLHAREWISPAVVTWIAKEFLTSDDPNVRLMAENIVWHIFPVVNPDGYTYTFTNDRLWRKNRNPANYVQCGDDDDIGNGVDLNRNFGFVWNTGGGSLNPCDQTYAGPEENSELETKSIIAYVELLKEQGDLVFYYSFHSLSQLVLIPYSHVAGSDEQQAPNFADMYEIAIRGADKIKEVHGLEYTVGSAFDIYSGATTGLSVDWVKGVAEVPIVFLFELRPVPGGYGFLLPPDQIVDNGEEIVAGLVEMDRVSRELGYYAIRSSGFILKINIWIVVALLTIGSL